MKTKKNSATLAAKAALSSVLALSVLSLTGCGKPTSADVECYGVSKFGANVAVVMPKGVCEKLADHRAVPMDANDYVECYGVAAAGMNDCATNSSACGGTAASARLPQAWIAIPKGICEQLTGSKVGAITSAPGSKPAASTTTAPATTAAPATTVSKPVSKAEAKHSESKSENKKVS
ncbi:MAG: DUF2282 domain-containing protein [Gammaproteobacteria bacterium]|nr:DUF2282 domain-containing protein [Gammaproteobacteria bacterium]